MAGYTLGTAKSSAVFGNRGSGFGAGFAGGKSVALRPLPMFGPAAPRMTTAAPGPGLPGPAPAPAPLPGGPITPTVPNEPPPEEKGPALGGLQSLGAQGGAEGEQLMGPGGLREGLGSRLYPELSAALAGLKRIY